MVSGGWVVVLCRVFDVFIVVVGFWLWDVLVWVGDVIRGRLWEGGCGEGD